MEKFDELLNKLIEAKITQRNYDWEGDIPEEIYKKYFLVQPYSIVAEGLDVSKHRWYETSTTVVRIFGRFLGIHRVTQLYSEMMMWEDCYHTIEFFEMEEVRTVTYKPKK
jgi:hypothetical protein